MITRLGLEREQIPQTIHPARPQAAAPSRPATIAARATGPARVGRAIPTQRDPE